MKSQKRVGVYFRVQNDQEGNRIWEELDQDKDAIRNEFGEEIMWNWEENGDISLRLYCEDVFADANRETIKDFFKTWLNNFVNVLRPRMKKITF